MEAIDNQINEFMNVIKNENGIIRSCVGATVDSKDVSRVLLTRYDSYGQRPIGYAKISVVLGEKETPQYSEDFNMVEHCLLQKTYTFEGNKSLLYMLPIHDKNDNLVGGYLFQKTKVDNGETIEFKGSVSAKRFVDLKKRQIPEEQWGTTPFHDKFIPIMPDTTFPLICDHYGAPKAKQSSILLTIAQLRKNQNG